jgi:uroporphyrinogen decarboxylase
MTPKQRLLAAIRHQPVDRIPTTFRCHKTLAQDLLRYFSVPEKPPDAEASSRTADDLSEHFRDLLRDIGADFWSSGSKVDRFATFVPRYSGPPPEPPYIDDGALFHALGIKSRQAEMGYREMAYPHIGIDPPLADLTSAADLENGFLTSRLDLFDFSRMHNRYREEGLDELADSQENIVCIGTLSVPFMTCSYLRGMERFLEDLAWEGPLVKRLVGEVGEFCLEFQRKELEATRGKAVYYGTWDDVAGQDGMLFSPELFRKLFLPIYRRLIDAAKRHGLVFGWHCCGSVHEVLPSMIEAGIDVFDVVQTSARDMDLETIHRRYGGNVCLHGGMDVQKLLVEQPPEAVRLEVRRAKDLWGTGGGIILAPSHEALPDTPIENLLALYEEVAG